MHFEDNEKNAPKISVVISCYNEESVILDSYKELSAELIKLKKHYEAIICDDGSTDDTLKVLKGIAKLDDKVKLMTYQPNRGYGYACRQLYKAASGEIIIQMDADLSMSPKDTLPIFTKEIEDVDIVIGSRYTGIRPEFPLYRLLPSKSALWLNRVLFNLPFNDTNSGFYAVRKKVLDEIELVCSDFEIATEIFLKARLSGFKIKEMPIKFVHKKDSGEANILKHGPKVLRDIFRLWRDINGRKLEPRSLRMEER